MHSTEHPDAETAACKNSRLSSFSKGYNKQFFMVLDTVGDALGVGRR